MPFSSNNGKLYTRTIIERYVKLKNPKSFKILDIGAGSGTYRNLFKDTIVDQCTWFAAEAWQPYIDQFKLKDIYNEVILADVTSKEFHDKVVELKPDLVFCGDVLEHMTKEQATELVKTFGEAAVLISIPIKHYPQGEWEGNPFEEHVKDDWSDKEVTQWLINDLNYPEINGNTYEDVGVYFVTNDFLDQAYMEAISPKVAIYGIMKNEEANVEKWIRAASDADEIVLIDTGSTDNSIKVAQEIAKKCKVNLILKKVSISPWRFDDAKNTALAFVSKDVDICISIDLDEALEDNWREFVDYEWDPAITRYNHRFRTIWDWKGENPVNVTEHWHERIHSRNGYIWKSPVHEYLVCENETLKFCELIMMTQRPDTTKGRPYLPLLYQAVDENPTQWKLWYFLGEELQKINEIDGCVKAWEKALLCPGVDRAYVLTALCYLVEYNFLQAYAYAQQILDEFGGNSAAREYYYPMVKLLIDSGNVKKAAELSSEVIAYTREIPTGYTYNPDAHGENSLFIRAIRENDNDRSAKY